MNKVKRWDVFVSHATPDKAEFVLPLAEALRSRGISVWLDRWGIELTNNVGGAWLSSRTSQNGGCRRSLHE